MNDIDREFDQILGTTSPERSPPDRELALSVPLHENPLVLDYAASRTFCGFAIKPQSDRLVLTSEDNAIITVLHRARIIKEEVESVEIDLTALLPKRTTLKKVARELRWQFEQETVDLVEALNAINAFSDPAVKHRLEAGKVHYNDLPVLFSRGVEVSAVTPSGLLGGVVETCVEVSSMFDTYFNISISVVLPTSKGCCLGKYNHRVYDFDPAVMTIDKLGIRPIAPEVKATLTERGKLFRTFTTNPTPATYNGKLTVPGWFRNKVFGADGRVMADATNFAQVDADLYYDMMRPFQIDEEAMAGTVKDDDLWRCYNRVQGFSMRLKRWGWLDVEGLKPVKWRDDAFNQLVLSEEHKKSVLHLVRHYGSSFMDFIEGKGGGLVFLLHGPTGSGKTLTAEAVAETLHRPLYSVSVGELGTTPESLEEKLRNILDLAFQWNAVLLLDEADIFMEARDTNNIERNAMVSIFLRLLEYYSGVLFLTTNRVSSFDPAFFSRISLAISYPRLEYAERHNVWMNMLASAGIDACSIDLDKLASYTVNGRNIKTAIRIAQTMAAGENREVHQDDLMTVLSLTEEFNEKLNI